VLTSSPLATREAAVATGVPIWGLEQLADPTAARDLYEDLLASRVPSAIHGDALRRTG
jgi:hypothetical protein